MEKGELIGIVSDRDLYKALGPKKNSKVIEEGEGKNSSELHVNPQKVRHIMHRGVKTVTRNTLASEAAALMIHNKIGALPVVEKNNRLIGIVTTTDILRAFVKLDRAGIAKEAPAQPG